jgi:hypothetical protein
VTGGPFIFAGQCAARLSKIPPVSLKNESVRFAALRGFSELTLFLESENDLVGFAHGDFLSRQFFYQFGIARLERFPPLFQCRALGLQLPDFRFQPLYFIPLPVVLGETGPENVRASGDQKRRKQPLQYFW